MLCICLLEIYFQRYAYYPVSILCFIKMMILKLISAATDHNCFYTKLHNFDLGGCHNIKLNGCISAFKRKESVCPYVGSRYVWQPHRYSKRLYQTMYPCQRATLNIHEVHTSINTTTNQCVIYRWNVLYYPM